MVCERFEGASRVNVPDQLPENDVLELPRADLTSREKEVLGLKAKDLTNNEIAKKLLIAESTVKNHLSKIGEKMGAASSLISVIRGIKKGIIDPNESLEGCDTNCILHLTQRQRQMLQTMISKEVSNNKQLADILQGSLSTVKNNMHNMLEVVSPFGVTNRTQLIVCFMVAQREGKA